MQQQYHQPVLVEEVLEYLAVEPGKVYVDGTLGTGGHSQRILEAGGKVIGIDQDEEAVKIASKRLEQFENITVINDNFNNLDQILNQLGIEQVDGIVLDLGTSMIQLDTPERGFSFSHDASLDMRMNSQLAVTAKDLVNGLGQKELYVLFTKYAQEQRARAISQAIVRARRIEPIETTGQLAAICEEVYGDRTTTLHPATKVFQALRMAVNDEVNVLKQVLPQAAISLAPGGRLLAISFHEGEDRVVKQFIRDTGELQALTKKPIVPSADEIRTNVRARSAKLRVAEKVVV